LRGLGRVRRSTASDLAVAAVMAFAAASTVETGAQLFVFDEPAA
jgi:hypothetical protein